MRDIENVLWAIGSRLQEEFGGNRAPEYKAFRAKAAQMRQQ